MSYNTLTAYYRYKRTNRKTGLYTLDEHYEIEPTQLSGVEKVKILKGKKIKILRGKKGPSKKEIEEFRKRLPPHYKIKIQNKGVIGNLYITQYIDNRFINCSVGYGLLHKSNFIFVAVFTKELKNLELRFSHNTGLDMHLLLDKFERGDLKDELEEMEKKSNDPN